MPSLNAFVLYVTIWRIALLTSCDFSVVVTDSVGVKKQLSRFFSPGKTQVAVAVMVRVPSKPNNAVWLCDCAYHNGNENYVRQLPKSTQHVRKSCSSANSGNFHRVEYSNRRPYRLFFVRCGVIENWRFFWRHFAERNINHVFQQLEQQHATLTAAVAAAASLPPPTQGIQQSEIPIRNCGCLSRNEYKKYNLEAEPSYTTQTISFPLQKYASVLHIERHFFSYKS